MYKQIQKTHYGTGWHVVGVGDLSITLPNGFHSMVAQPRLQKTVADADLFCGVGGPDIGVALQICAQLAHTYPALDPDFMCQGAHE